MASVFPAEIPPDRIREVSSTFNTTVVKFEKSNNRQFFANQRHPTERWKLEWAVMHKSHMAILMDHFNERRGAFRAFQWTDSRLPTSKIVRFAQDTITFDKINDAFVNVSVEVEA